MKQLTALCVATAACMALIACGGNGVRSTGPAPIPRTVSFQMIWGGGGVMAQSARISIYSGDRALTTQVVNAASGTAQLTVPDGSVTGVRLHAEAFSGADGTGDSEGELDAELPLSALGSSEVTVLSTAEPLTYEIEGTSGGRRVGEPLDLVAVPRDANGNLCFSPEPTWSVDDPTESTLDLRTVVLTPPGREESVGSRQFARVSRGTPGGVRVSVSLGAASSGLSATFEDFNIPTESTWEGTWTGILEDGREGFPGETLYTTVIEAAQGGNFPISWTSSFYEPYVFNYEAFLEGNSLVAFAGTVTLTRDGESLVVSQPNDQQIARLRRTNRAINLRSKIGASRRLSSGNVEVDLILTNESASGLTGIELQNETLDLIASIPGNGSSAWPNGRAFGTLEAGASARRTLTFPSSVLNGVRVLSFGISTQQGLANYSELRVVVPAQGL